MIDGRLVDCLLDPEQQVALLDVLPFGEIALLDEAGHPRDDVDLVDRRYASDEIARFRDLTAHHRGHRDRRRRRAALWAAATLQDAVTLSAHIADFQARELRPGIKVSPGCKGYAKFAILLLSEGGSRSGVILTGDHVKASLDPIGSVRGHSQRRTRDL